MGSFYPVVFLSYTFFFIFAFGLQLNDTFLAAELGFWVLNISAMRVGEHSSKQLCPTLSP